MAKDLPRPGCHCRPIARIVSAIVVAEVQKRNKEKPTRVSRYVQCSTTEDSYHLHDLYKDTVTKTERDPEKMAKIENDIMEFCRKRRLSHDLRHIKVEKSSLADRRPSILDHMHHGDEDEESVKEFGLQETTEPTTDGASEDISIPVPQHARTN